MQNNFEKKCELIFDEWLFSKDKSYNPFTRMFAEIGENLPEIPMPDIINLEERNKNYGKK